MEQTQFLLLFNVKHLHTMYMEVFSLPVPFYKRGFLLYMSATGCILSNVSLVFYHGNGLLKSGLKSGMIPFITVGPLCSLCSAPKNWVAE